MLALEKEQEVIGVISNLVMLVYSMESTLLRVQKKLQRQPPETCAPDLAAARAYIGEAADRAESEARRALARISEGDVLRTHLSVLRRFLRRAPPDSIGLKRQLADRALELNRYPFP
jgi:hypothetical protein